MGLPEAQSTQQSVIKAAAFLSAYILWSQEVRALPDRISEQSAEEVTKDIKFFLFGDRLRRATSWLLYGLGENDFLAGDIGGSRMLVQAKPNPNNPIRQHQAVVIERSTSNGPGKEATITGLILKPKDDADVPDTSTFYRIQGQRRYPLDTHTEAFVSSSISVLSDFQTLCRSVVATAGSGPEATEPL